MSHIEFDEDGYIKTIVCNKSPIDPLPDPEMVEDTCSPLESIVKKLDALMGMMRRIVGKK